MTYTNDQVLSRDLGESMIPEHEMYGEQESEDEGESEDNDGGEAPGNPMNASIVGGPGTPIQQTGPSYYVQQAVAAQLNTMNTGR
jgi:hypothetical protein